MTFSVQAQMAQMVIDCKAGPSIAGAGSAALLLGSSNAPQMSLLLVMFQATQLAVGSTAGLQRLQQEVERLQSDLGLHDMPGTTADATAPVAPTAAMPENAAQKTDASESTAPEYTSLSAASPEHFSSQVQSQDRRSSETASSRPSLAADTAQPSEEPSEVPANTDDPWDGNSPWYDAEASPRNLAGSSDSDWAGEAYQQDVLEQRSPNVPDTAAQDNGTAETLEATGPDTPSELPLSKFTCVSTACRECSTEASEVWQGWPLTCFSSPCRGFRSGVYYSSRPVL